MPRAKRCEFQGATYLATVNGYPGGHVFYDPQIFVHFPENPRAHAPDAEYFQNLLWDACEQYDARVHAYALGPNTARLVIQTLGAPLGWSMHDMLTRYSRHLIERTKIPVGMKPFPRRHRAQIVQPAKLPYAVRYVHRTELATRPHRTWRPLNHPFSSSLIYCDRRPRPARFTVSATRDALSTLGYFGPSGYLDFMGRGDTPAIAQMLLKQVIGEKSFVQSVGARCLTPQRIPSSDELLREVTNGLLHADPHVACSPTHLGALARALVAWYAMRTGTAQIGMVSKWFGVTSSNLRYLIRHHRGKTPQYFTVATPELFPHLSKSSVTRLEYRITRTELTKPVDAPHSARRMAP